MSIEDSIKNCEIYLKQINQYDPDPYYVNYFFSKYIDAVNDITDGIFEEANRDFGLFITDKISKEKFFEKATSKKDENAIKFFEWYVEKYNEEHKNTYPNIIRNIIEFKIKFKKLPAIKIMMRSSERFKDDIYQEIKFNSTNGKLRSKEELQIEVKRQLPIFLEIINHKRNGKNEPKVRENQVIASAFLDVGEHDNVEIAYTVKIYIPVIKRLVNESREKIKELTVWK